MKTIRKISVCLLAVLLALSAGSASAANTRAVLSPQKLLVDGAPVSCEKYNIDGSNYFKLRDMAYLLNGTGSSFSVDWDAASATVSITVGRPYVPNGSELAVGGDKSSTAVASRQTILVNGVARSDFSVYNIGGNNFFKLRDLGAALNFAVDYDADTNTAVVDSAQGKTVLVDSVDELLRQLGDDTTIYLAPGVYNLTDWIENTVTGIDEYESREVYPGVSVQAVFDGAEISLGGFENLTLIGSGAELTTVVVEPRYANVLAFEDCQNISLSRMTFGHTVEKGYCVGNVLFFDSCDSVSLDELDLYGCGTYGICADTLTYATVTNTVIHDCSYGALSIGNSYAISFEDCILRDNEELDTLCFYCTGAVSFDRCTFTGNVFDYCGVCSFLSLENEDLFGDGSVVFDSCTFGKDEFNSLLNSGLIGNAVTLTDSKVE